MISCANKDLDGYLEPLGKFIEYCRITALLPVIPLGIIHGLRTSRESFQKFETFWLGQTNWAEILWYIWGIFGQTISTILALWVPCPSERVAGSFSYKKLWFLSQIPDNSWHFLSYHDSSCYFLSLLCCF